MIELLVPRLFQAVTSRRLVAVAAAAASFVKRYHNPKSMTGVDFAKKAVRFCQNHYDVDGLSFVHGDAENVPFGDEVV